MGNIKIPYYVVKKGHGYWQPTKTMRLKGFASIRCGIDGPIAWAKAEEMNREWQRFRHGLAATERDRWPNGSIGQAFERLKLTGEWARMEPRTREDWERGNRMIEPVFGDVAPSTVIFEHVDAFYGQLFDEKGVSESYRAIKHWRRLWKKMAAMGLCVSHADPSAGIRRISPAPRSQVWSEREAALLAKTAFRHGYMGLACIIAVAWDTQFSPVDVRSLDFDQIRERQGRITFERVFREKTGREVIGTITRKTERLVRVYLHGLAERGISAGIIFRHRKWAAYSKDTLGDDFRTVRAIAYPGDKRVLMDMRRSGAVEAAAGEVDPNALAAKMGNTINSNRQLQRTYQPSSLAAVRKADEARKLGRRNLAEAEKLELNENQSWNKSNK